MVVERKIEITSLKVKLGKTEATLTIEEAKKLKAALENIFGKEVQTVYPSYPIIIEREVPYWRYPTPIWYGDNSSTTPRLQMDNSGQMLCTIKEN